MAVSRQKKIEVGDALSADLQTTLNLIVGTFNKLTVSQDFELRKAVRAAGGKYKVVKNTIARRASKGTKVEEALQTLKGINSIAYTEGDPVALAKAIQKYAADVPEFQVKAGVVEGRVVGLDQIKALATMPSKEELYSKLLFLISAPAQRLVTVLGATGRDLAVVVNQGVKENKFSGASEASA
ncbi:MAG: 50S ribosomal protein L10 [Acidobacteriaceae bacterium]